MEASTSIMNPSQTTRIDLDEPMSQLAYANDQRESLQESQDVEMAMGGDSQEMYFRVAQTDERGSQIRGAHKLTHKNTVLDITSPWARSWRRHEIQGGEVFYHPKVGLPWSYMNAGHMNLTGPSHRLSHSMLPMHGIMRWTPSTPVSVALNLLFPISDGITGYQPTLTVYGRPYTQPRSIAAYVVDPSLPAPKYSNHKVVLHYPYPPILQHIQDFITRTLGVGFDHVMLNRYASGNVGIGRHRDTKENQVIAVLSLGAERTFVMTPHVSSKGVPKVRCRDRKWTLGNGSLLVMQGDTQNNWKVRGSVFIGSSQC
jgi:alkylated DNA repair dioxygenase AlkB